MKHVLIACMFGSAVLIGFGDFRGIETSIVVTFTVGYCVSVFALGKLLRIV